MKIIYAIWVAYYLTGEKATNLLKFVSILEAKFGDNSLSKLFQFKYEKLNI